MNSEVHACSDLFVLFLRVGQLQEAHLMIPEYLGRPARFHCSLVDISPHLVPICTEIPEPFTPFYPVMSFHS